MVSEYEAQDPLPLFLVSASIDYLRDCARFCARFVREQTGIRWFPVCSLTHSTMEGISKKLRPRT